MKRKLIARAAPSAMVFATLLLLVPPLAAQTLTISEIVVGGIPEAEAKRIKALLPFAEGSSFASIEKARKLAGFAKAYLEQDEGFAVVDIEIEEAGEGVIEVYVFPRLSTIAGLSVFESQMTTIPNFPTYGVGMGFSVGTYEQLLGLDLPLARWISIDLAAGHSLSIEQEHAVSGKAGFSLKPLPLLSAYAFAGLDSYSGSDGARPADAYGQAGARLKLDFLSRLVLFGPSIEVSYRRGFLDFPYAAMRGKAALAFKPFDFFWAEAMANFYSVTGEAASLAMTKSAGTRELRLVPRGIDETGALASASLTGNIGLPFKVPLGVASLSFSLFGFLEASEPYSRLADLGTLGEFPLKAYSPAVGGGLVLAFSPPFSLLFEIGCGYSLETKKAVFLLRLL